uniref:Uncharacterized protein n=1 Tax=Timema genevievae TaxID=629358 RepID=A0A7R9PIR4_TIMGE|nr:unnamed protein product [Timema genevievae]
MLTRAYQFKLEELESFNYRANDAWRAVTRTAVREARLKEIKQEIFNCRKLQGHFFDNPRDLQSLRHDKALHTVKVQSQLSNVPDYIVPTALKRVAGLSNSRKRRAPPSTKAPAKIRYQVVLLCSTPARAGLQRSVLLTSLWPLHEQAYKGVLLTSLWPLHEQAYKGMVRGSFMSLDIPDCTYLSSTCLQYSSPVCVDGVLTYDNLCSMLADIAEQRLYNNKPALNNLVYENNYNKVTRDLFHPVYGHRREDWHTYYFPKEEFGDFQYQPPGSLAEGELFDIESLPNPVFQRREWSMRKAGHGGRRLRRSLAKDQDNSISVLSSQNGSHCLEQPLIGHQNTSNQIPPPEIRQLLKRYLNGRDKPLSNRMSPDKEVRRRLKRSLIGEQKNISSRIMPIETRQLLRRSLIGQERSIGNRIFPAGGRRRLKRSLIGENSSISNMTSPPENRQLLRRSLSGRHRKLSTRILPPGGRRRLKRSLVGLPKNLPDQRALPQRDNQYLKQSLTEQQRNTSTMTSPPENRQLLKRYLRDRPKSLSARILPIGGRQCLKRSLRGSPQNYLVKTSSPGQQRLIRSTPKVISKKSRPLKQEVFGEIRDEPMFDPR